jgi:DNA repair ATPase RecN
MPTLNDILARNKEEPQGIERLTPRQRRSINALLETRTFSAAAVKAGVNRRSIYRWLRTDEVFREKYRAVQRETMAQTTARLQAISKDAAEVLANLINREKIPVSSLVSAIRTALEYAYRAVELEDIETRLVDIEEAGKKYGPRPVGRF